MIALAAFPPRTRVDFDVVAASYLLVVGVALPVAAVRSRAALRGRARRAPDRTSILTRAIIGQLVLFALSLFVARDHSIPLWQSGGFDPADMVIGASALVVLGGVGYLSWRLHSPDERRALWIRHILPHTRMQWVLWLVVSAVAGLSEETTFRGVLVVLFGALTASWAIAILLSALVFALAHYPQGVKAMALVFGIALVMQFVVFATGTLYIAIGVHAIYDFTAGVRVSQELG